MGSFHIGGRIAEISGKPVREIQRQPGGPITKFDPNGQYMVEQMYVQYFLPKNRKGKLPLLMWHGGGLTGATYESTPDGREGWLNMFVRYGWDVYNSDAVERGRSGFAPPEVWPNEPTFLPYQDPFERFRIGDGEGSWNADPGKAKVIPGSQFPVEAYANYMRQTVPRWLSTDEPIIAGLCRAGRQDLSVRDAGAQPGRRVRLQGGGAAPRQDQGHRRGRIGDRRHHRQCAQAERRAGADGVRRLRRSASALGGVQKMDTEYANAIKAAGGTVDWINLPEIGIKGNSHMLMQDRNNAESRGCDPEMAGRQRSVGLRPPPNLSDLNAACYCTAPLLRCSDTSSERCDFKRLGIRADRGSKKHARPGRGRFDLSQGPHRHRRENMPVREGRLGAYFGGHSVQETGVRNKAYGADKFGLKDLQAVHWNLTDAPLYEHAIASRRRQHRCRRRALRGDRPSHRPLAEGQAYGGRRSHPRQRVVGRQPQALEREFRQSLCGLPCALQRQVACSRRISMAAPTRPIASRCASSPNSPGTRCSSARC